MSTAFTGIGGSEELIIYPKPLGISKIMIIIASFIPGWSKINKIVQICMRNEECADAKLSRQLTKGGYNDIRNFA